MTTQQQAMIVSDFEKYIQHLIQQKEPFTLDKFILFATSLVNFYSGSKLISATERLDTSLILSKSFNSGIGNTINKDDLQEISELIISDPQIDYSILNPIFG